MGRKRRKQIAWDETGTQATFIGGVSDEDLISRGSKRGQAKQAIQERRQLIEDCLGLEDEAWVGFEIPRQLENQFEQLKSMKGSGARQRLLKFVVTQTQEDTWETLQQVYAKVSEAEERLAKRSQKLAAWRDRLIKEGEDALLPAQTRFPHADIHVLRKLIFQVQRDPQSKMAKGAGKLLLQYLHDWDH